MGSFFSPVCIGHASLPRISMRVTSRCFKVKLSEITVNSHLAPTRCGAAVGRVISKGTDIYQSGFQVLLAGTVTESQIQITSCYLQSRGIKCVGFGVSRILELISGLSLTGHMI